MTTQIIIDLAAAILSLLASYLPGFSDWFDQQTPTLKRLIMLGLLLLVVVLTFAAACASLTETVTCDQPGAWGLLRLFFDALIINQATYLISPPRRGDSQNRPSSPAQDATHVTPSNPSFPG
ncbi:MAG: hypothetical protein AB1894_15700 [Chloroflexota bacterium]